MGPQSAKYMSSDSSLTRGTATDLVLLHLPGPVIAHDRPKANHTISVNPTVVEMEPGEFAPLILA